ncbi:MAG TPA: stage III sporulation AC/AD family protein [Candidatus Egerieimonas intestinavium]|uniref:Stage III sporulation AC/AD family protein n=1 Tax=Candidatus Egerieimonas intestinavium TaxID=2840777 RepID=A0A9D1EJH8_9FIRM|nr:stage III sporulation AC/AD family protein [Candidatus Egerieimonas intestinavium]
MDVVKIAVLGLMGVMVGLFFKQARPEYTLYISLATGLLILILAAGKLEAVFALLRQIQAYLPIKTAYVTAILKMVGIAYIGQFSAGLCRDAGYSSVAGQIELFCKLSILLISLPILLALLETLQGFLG